MREATPPKKMIVISSGLGSRFWKLLRTTMKLNAWPPSTIIFIVVTSKISAWLLLHRTSRSTRGYTAFGIHKNGSYPENAIRENAYKKAGFCPAICTIGLTTMHTKHFSSITQHLIQSKPENIHQPTESHPDQTTRWSAISLSSLYSYLRVWQKQARRLWNTKRQISTVVNSSSVAPTNGTSVPGFHSGVVCATNGVANLLLGIRNAFPVFLRIWVVLLMPSHVWVRWMGRRLILSSPFPRFKKSLGIWMLRMATGRSSRRAFRRRVRFLMVRVFSCRSGDWVGSRDMGGPITQTSSAKRTWRSSDISLVTTMLHGLETRAHLRTRKVNRVAVPFPIPKL